MIIGITGGTGSGKSTVAKILKHLGAKVINADRIAKDVTRKGEQAFKEIVEHFGEDIVGENGELDRRKLGSIVFKDKEKLNELNNITHRYIVEKILDKARKIAEDDKSAVIVIDAALPLKHGFLDVVDKVWVVASDIKNRIERIMQRDGLTYEEAENRIKSQLSEDKYIEMADEVLLNNGDITELEKETIKLFLKLKKYTG